ncbi:hypothetical protein FOA52_006105 [Chlamydomonas sp. UWO 241]|nr:hypothetical protein FOA52_006105 [Chlamydomonas sp. UWO 241]
MGKALAFKKGSGSMRAEADTSKLAAQVASAQLESLVKGAKVWVRVSEQSWEPGELRSAADADGGATVQLEGRGARGGAVTVAPSALAPRNPTLQEGIPDLTHLSFLNEPGILYNLQYRYGTDQIYTFAGPVLIALNPCKSLPLYDTATASAYKAAAQDTVHVLEPHIYLVAANAFRKMLREGASQSLIVNGESGAGKTENTKKAMQYFATLAGGTGVEGAVLETNPVLEAFGNAKTLRNHNSSRFGKLIQIHFNASNRICGARIKTYLLEKSRVVHQLPGERSYHIFYQLVKGASSAQRALYRLPAKPEEYRYLSSSGCTSIKGVDDAPDFLEVVRCMRDVGIDEEAQGHLFATLSGLLWLGNVELQPKHQDDDSTVVENNDALDAASSLLGLDKVRLCMSLTHRRIVTPHEIVLKVLNVDEAREARDALAKAIYSSIFNWLVECINAKLDNGKRSSGNCISILDIYGFEQFTTNSFEQLCINYANERLQQQFTRHLFKLEQEEYESEGIDWTKVEFSDNQECVDVIEMAPPKGLGVLSVLDAQCKFPKATDSTLAYKLRETLSEHAHFGFNPRKPDDFAILHYAGEVQYSCSGFLDKNKDSLSGDLLELLQGSSARLVARLGTAVREELETVRTGGQTVGGRFSVQLRELIEELDQTGLHFVRCIKPNAQLQPNSFDAPMTLQQLRCCGVLEVARVARAGFPTRYTLHAFADRYAILLEKEEQDAILSGTGEQARAAVLALLQKFQLQQGHYQIGRTKVFFRAGVLGFVEDKWAHMQRAVVTIQSRWRMYLARRQFLATRAAALALQSCWKARGARREYAEEMERKKAALVLQTAWRARIARIHFQSARRAALAIQMAWRRYCFRRGVRTRERARLMLERAARAEQESFAVLRNKYGVDMSDVQRAIEAYAGGGAAGAAAAAVAAGHTSVAARDADTADADAAAAEVEAAAATAAAAAAVAAAAAAAAAAEAEAADARSAPPPVECAEASCGTEIEGLSSALVVLPDDHATSTRERYERVQELTIEVERGRLERSKLTKEMAALKMLKERDNTRAVEAQAKMMGMIRELQAYVSLVKGEYAKQNLDLPPLPPPLLVPLPVTDHLSGAAAAEAPSEAQSQATSRRPTTETGTDTEKDASRGPAAAASAAGAAAASHRIGRDDDDQLGSGADGDMSAFAVTTGAAAAAAAAGTSSSLSQLPPGVPLTDDAQSSVSASSSAQVAHGTNGHPGGYGTAAASSGALGARPGGMGPGGAAPSTSSSSKYVKQLAGELGKVSQVLHDDVDFIVEVRQGLADAPDMDPAYELAKLKKKFEIWKREFRDKLGTTEDVLRKLDRMQGGASGKYGSMRAASGAYSQQPSTAHGGSGAYAQQSSVAHAGGDGSVRLPAGATPTPRVQSGKKGIMGLFKS